MNEIPLSVGAKSLIKFLSESVPVDLPTDINNGLEGKDDLSDDVSDDEYEESFDFDKADEDSEQILNNSDTSEISRRELEASYFRDDPIVAAYSASGARETTASRGDRGHPSEASAAAAELLQRIQHINQASTQHDPSAAISRTPAADRSEPFKFERPLSDAAYSDSYPETSNKFEIADYRAEIARLRDLLVNEKEKFKDLVSNFAY
jgi:hypothetical protein